MSKHKAASVALLAVLALVCPAVVGTKRTEPNDLWSSVSNGETVEARLTIVRAFARTGSEENLMFVAAALTDPDASVRNSALATMRSMKGPAAFHALERSMLDGNSWELGHLLADYRDQKYVQFLCKDLRHKSRDVRLVSALALSLQGAPEALPILKKMVNDPDEHVRWEVMNALGRYGGGR